MKKLLCLIVIVFFVNCGDEDTFTIDNCPKCEMCEICPTCDACEECFEPGENKKIEGRVNAGAEEILNECRISKGEYKEPRGVMMNPYTKEPVIYEILLAEDEHNNFTMNINNNIMVSLDVSEIENDSIFPKYKLVSNDNMCLDSGTWGWGKCSVADMEVKVEGFLDKSLSPPEFKIEVQLFYMDRCGGNMDEPGRTKFEFYGTWLEVESVCSVWADQLYHQENCIGLLPGCFINVSEAEDELNEDLVSSYRQGKGFGEESKCINLLKEE